MKRIKYVYFYFLFLLYLIVGFFGDVPFISKGIYENLYNYVGLMLIPTLLFFVSQRKFNLIKLSEIFLKFSSKIF